MIRLTDHAIQRYQERVKPHFTLDEAQVEARRLLEYFAAIQTERPNWFDDATGEHDQPFDGYAMIGDGIAFPLRGSRAITCVTVGSMGDEARTARNHRRRGRQRARNARRMKWKDTKTTNADRSRSPRRKDWSDAAA